MYINLLTQLKNAQAVGKDALKTTYSKMDERVLDVLKKNNFIEAYAKKGRGIKKVLDIKLKYFSTRGESAFGGNGKKSAIQDVKFISKPSRRVQVGYRELRPVKHGYGLLVVSTSQGVMAGKEARKLKVGGEALFEIW